LENTKSRNLSNRRVERIILNILLNIKAGMMDFEINYVRILGLGKKEIIKNFKIQENFLKKIKIEKNGFLLKELFLEKKEKLNPIVYKKNFFYKTK